MNNCKLLKEKLEQINQKFQYIEERGLETLDVGFVESELENLQKNIQELKDLLKNAIEAYLKDILKESFLRRPFRSVEVKWKNNGEFEIICEGGSFLYYIGKYPKILNFCERIFEFKEGSGNELLSEFDIKDKSFDTITKIPIVNRVVFENLESTEGVILREGVERVDFFEKLKSFKGLFIPSSVRYIALRGFGSDLEYLENFIKLIVKQSLNNLLIKIPKKGVDESFIDNLKNKYQLESKGIEIEVDKGYLF